MKKIKKILIILVITISGLICLSNFSVFSSNSSPCQNHNVQGWAWSERTGWISFSCENCDSDLNGQWDGGECGTGESIDYGVDIDSDTGEMSGYAWSERAGWISFRSEDLAGCPSEPCEAKVDFATGGVSGWAKAVNADGWSSWIRLRDSDYGVEISGSEFKGWAWSDEAIGWVSFNCSNTNWCSTSDYKVTTDLTIPLPVPSDSQETFSYCTDSLHPILSWNYPAETDGYKIEVYKEGLLIYQYEALGTSSKSHSFFDPGTCHENNGFQNEPVCDLEYNKSYNWRVKVKDQGGNWSPWSDWSTFSTPSHQFPYTDFSWSPQNPRVGEEVQFTDETSWGEGAGKNWSWTIPDAQYTGETNSSSQNPKVIFQTQGEKEVILQTTDNTLDEEGNCGPGCCQISKIVNVRHSLPGWEEIHPGE